MFAITILATGDLTAGRRRYRAVPGAVRWRRRG